MFRRILRRRAIRSIMGKGRGRAGALGKAIRRRRSRMLLRRSLSRRIRPGIKRRGRGLVGPFAAARLIDSDL